MLYNNCYLIKFLNTEIFIKHLKNILMDKLKHSIFSSLTQGQKCDSRMTCPELWVYHVRDIEVCNFMSLSFFCERS